MTKERREEVVLVALGVSLVLHIGLMFLMRPQVMTSVSPYARKPAAHEPVRVTRAANRPDPVKIAELMEIKPVREAPRAPAGEIIPLSAPEPTATALPDIHLPVRELPAPTDVAVFDVSSTVRGKARAKPLTISHVETPVFSAAAPAAPQFSADLPQLAAARSASLTEAPRRDPESVLLPATVRRRPQRSLTFKPPSEIFGKVDEQVISAEKAAVRELVEAEDAAELEKFVNVTMTSTTVGEWTYFKVMVVPRSSLAVVPKDVVILIDGSGSIGNDRLGSCRKAARQILRTCTNTGDRFNLVVFRNAFSYCFRTWRDCDAASFAAADRWLNAETSHGRTDVFGSIASVLTLPRDPTRPLVALVVTDGIANEGVSDTEEILSRFTALNDGLVSVYMYGVKSSANRDLIDVLTHGNRGESFVFDGWRWNAGDDLGKLSERFRDPVLSDLRIVFSTETPAACFPRQLKNIYRGETLSIHGRVPKGTQNVAFSLKGLNGACAYEGYFKLPLAVSPADPAVADAWRAEEKLDRSLRKR